MPEITTTIDPSTIMPTPRTYETIINPNANLAPAPAMPKLITAISTIRDMATSLEAMGFNLEVEELDLQGTYRVVIEINKN